MIQNFLSVALPIVIAMFAAVYGLISTNNRRLDDIRGDLKDLRGDIKTLRDETTAGFKQVNETLKTYGEKIAVLEERTSPLGRRG